MNLWNSMKADTFRQYGQFSWGRLIKGALMRRTFRVVVTMRLCQAASSSRGAFRIALPLVKVMHHIATNWAAIDLSWQTEIGAGITLNHAWGLVVSHGVRIGKNVTLFHGATLGRHDRILVKANA